MPKTRYSAKQINPFGSFKSNLSNVGIVIRQVAMKVPLFRLTNVSTLYRADIDGLRAFAVVSVLLFHLEIPYFPGGFVGVDIFFVISGFLITGLIKKEFDETGRFRFGEFYLRRVRRLFPALFFVLLLTSIASILLLSPAYLKNYGGSLVFALVSASNIFFWNESDYFDLSASVKPLLHTWSLSVEEQFYVFWPLLLLLLLRARPILFAPALIFLLGLMSLGACIPFGKGGGGEWNIDGRSTIFYLLPFRVFEFALGALMVWVVNLRIESRFVYNLLFSLGLVLMIHAVLKFHSEMLLPSYRSLVPCVGAALVIYAGRQATVAKILSNFIVVSLGLISYSLYLIHWPLIVFWQYLGGSLGGIEKVLISLLSIFLAYASYRYIEQPFRTKRLDIAASRWRYPAITASVVLLVTGIHLFQSEGWGWRSSPSPVVFEAVGSAAAFHRKFYGGSGYPYYGPVKTNEPAGIVVVGDSHGRQYAEGVFKVFAKPNNLDLYIAAGSSCLHLPNFTRTSEGHDWDRICSGSFNQALDYINRGRYPLIILSHSWTSQMSKADLLDLKGERLGRKIEIEDIILGILAFKDRVGDSPLVVIGEVPKAGENLYDIFTRPRPFFMADRDREKYLFTQEKPRVVEFNAHLRRAAEVTGKFIFLDPHDVLCKDRICRNVNSQRQLIYSDSGHLSKYGSIDVIAGFLAQLEAALRVTEVSPLHDTGGDVALE